jgi:hypothetical protein
MGDYILMKTFCIIFIVFITTLNASSDLKWVNKQVDAIKPARSGIADSYIDSLKDPIEPENIKKESTVHTSKTSSSSKIIGKTTKVNYQKPLRLQAVINMSAYINGKWYSINERIRGKKITLIKKNYVVLKYKSRETRLFVNNKNDRIKITTK